MNTEHKSHKELFSGLCDVLADNGQALNEGQRSAIESFLDVIVESTNKNWSAAVKEYSDAQKKAYESKCSKIKSDFDKAEAKAKSSEHSETMKMLEEIKTGIETAKNKELDEAREELAKFKETSTKAAKDLVAAEAAKRSKLEVENKSLRETVKTAESTIRSLRESLRAEQLKNYLESKVSGLPIYEANLLRKRFATATSRSEIDENFDRALVGVRDRRNSASSVPRANPTLEVQPNIYGNAKPQGKVDLLTEASATPAVDSDEGNFFYQEEDAIPQDEMAKWLSLLGSNPAGAGPN